MPFPEDELLEFVREIKKNALLLQIESRKIYSLDKKKIEKKGKKIHTLAEDVEKLISPLLENLHKRK